MSKEDATGKTAIVSEQTLVSQFRKIHEAPPSLVVVMGPIALIGRQYPLQNKEYLFGRSPECDIQIEDRSVSRNHARFIVHLDEVQIIDLNSANKTYVNETRLQPNIPFTLRNNDQIKCGNVYFKFFEKGNLQAYANEKLLEKALKDPLTGAFSKRALLERAPEIMKRSQFNNDPITILVFDIDYFKKINDTYGHPGGDFVLKELGQLVANHVIRAEDYFARYGGEEFVIILSNANQQIGTEVAERMRKKIEQHKFNYNGINIPVTISVGVCQKQDSDQDWETLFNRADSALYAAKQSGRNRVVVA
ncbi:MAG: GGDEF domain-containing protein [Bdellovibrionaceae bacterium]|nr:GGDEF domain-containing protein [Pseudobdellovibrionaceae bacterium]MDW8190355.1 GGDEF domain-containing protein [Pseudobdellovibrionaceae bacterium]